jgi:hypothetical protein
MLDTDEYDKVESERQQCTIYCDGKNKLTVQSYAQRTKMDV